MSKPSTFPHFATLAIHEGQEPEQWTSMAVVPPVSFSTTFKQKEPGVYKYDYSRGGNPTRECLERCIAAMDDAKHCKNFWNRSCTVSLLNYLILSLVACMAMHNLTMN